MAVSMTIRELLPISMAVFFVMLGISYPAAAQNPAAPNAAKNQPPFDPKDLSGQWSGGLGGGLHSIGQPPPLLPEAQAKFEANTAELKTTGVITIDPTF